MPAVIPNQAAIDKARKALNDLATAIITKKESRNDKGELVKPTDANRKNLSHHHEPIFNALDSLRILDDAIKASTFANVNDDIAVSTAATSATDNFNTVIYVKPGVERTSGTSFKFGKKKEVDQGAMKAQLQILKDFVASVNPAPAIPSPSVAAPAGNTAATTQPETKVETTAGSTSATPSVTTAVHATTVLPQANAASTAATSPATQTVATAIPAATVLPQASSASTAATPPAKQQPVAIATAVPTATVLPQASSASTAATPPAKQQPVAIATAVPTATVLPQASSASTAATPPAKQQPVAIATAVPTATVLPQASSASTAATPPAKQQPVAIATAVPTATVLPQASSASTAATPPAKQQPVSTSDTTGANGQQATRTPKDSKEPASPSIDVQKPLQLDSDGIARTRKALLNLAGVIITNDGSKTAEGKLIDPLDKDGKKKKNLSKHHEAFFYALQSLDTAENVIAEAKGAELLTAIDAVQLKLKNVIFVDGTTERKTTKKEVDQVYFAAQMAAIRSFRQLCLTKIGVQKLDAPAVSASNSNVVVASNLSVAVSLPTASPSSNAPIPSSPIAANNAFVVAAGKYNALKDRKEAYKAKLAKTESTLETTVSALETTKGKLTTSEEKLELATTTLGSVKQQAATVIAHVTTMLRVWSKKTIALFAFLAASAGTAGGLLLFTGLLMSSNPVTAPLGIVLMGLGIAGLIYAFDKGLDRSRNLKAKQSVDFLGNLVDPATAGGPQATSRILNQKNVAQSLLPNGRAGGIAEEAVSPAPTVPYPTRKVGSPAVQLALLQGGAAADGSEAKAGPEKDSTIVNLNTPK